MTVGLIVLAIAFLALLSALLGTMREVVLLRLEVSTISGLITHPPPPSFLHRRLPALAQTRLEDAIPADGSVHVLAFVSPGCGACHDFIESLTSAIGRGRVDGGAVSFVLAWTKADEDCEPLDRTAPCVVDGDGAIARSCEIRATPTLLAVVTDTMTVIGHKPGGDVEWLEAMLKTNAQEMSLDRTSRLARA
jgi:hypothetical protein